VSDLTKLIANLKRLNDPATEDDSITTEDAIAWIDAAIEALEAAEPPTTVEWGVRITTVGHNTLHNSKESAEADVEFWKNRIEPDPNATKFPRALIRRTAATEWELVK
jgi:hypothetical protein